MPTATKNKIFGSYGRDESQCRKLNINIKSSRSTGICISCMPRYDLCSMYGSNRSVGTWENGVPRSANSYHLWLLLPFFQPLRFAPWAALFNSFTTLLYPTVELRVRPPQQIYTNAPKLGLHRLAARLRLWNWISMYLAVRKQGGKETYGDSPWSSIQQKLDLSSPAWLCWCWCSVPIWHLILRCRVEPAIE